MHRTTASIKKELTTGNYGVGLVLFLEKPVKPLIQAGHKAGDDVVHAPRKSLSFSATGVIEKSKYRAVMSLT